MSCSPIISIPDPAQKKGIYGVLLNIGENEGWVTVHASTVKVITPYDNEIVIMHEGASGGGKSEMIEQIHKQPDGRILLGQNLVTDETYYLELTKPARCFPLPTIWRFATLKCKNGSRKLAVKDAEQGCFLRLDHIKHYGTTPQYEKIFTHPSEPLLFLNIQGVRNPPALYGSTHPRLRRHPLPNPRVILPRRLIPNVIHDTVEVDVRSFGVRTPPAKGKTPPTVSGHVPCAAPRARMAVETRGPKRA
jgi:hypothetical protein